MIRDYMSSKGIGTELVDKILEFTKAFTYKPGDTIMHMGEKTQVVCLVTNGLVRGYCLGADGKEITKCFTKEGEWCCFNNFSGINAELFYVEALEETELAQISVKPMKELMEEYPELKAVYAELLDNALLGVETKDTEFQKLPVGERYAAFAGQNPDLVKRVKLEYINSYLGIE